MELEIRPIAPEEYSTFVRTDDAAFGERHADDFIEALRPLTELDRTLAAFDGERMAATAAAFSFELTLPGLTRLPVAAVTAVGVLPTHRRRGLLRALMRRQLANVRERGEAIAALACSESAIYGRFGYGLATSTIAVEMDRRHAGFARPVETSGRMTLLDHEQALPVFAALYDRVRRSQPGALGRSAEYWKVALRDPTQPAGDLGPRFYAVYESGVGDVEGAVHYRVKLQWEHGLAGNTLEIGELIAATPEAYAALWHFCLNMDLVHLVRARNRPVDETLRWMLADPRRLRVASLIDDLWVRLVDVPAALAARRYGAADRLVLDLSDPFRLEQTGRYALEGGPEGAQCHLTTADADLTLDVADLGAAYLGGVRFTTLARAGRVRALTSRALERADALFASDPAPWCATSF